jgi:imidazolonepropionase-like amidohydrolase
MRFTLIAILFLFTTAAPAQPSATPQPPSTHHLTYLNNLTLIDGTGREAQPQVTVVIKDGRIETITRGKLAVPPGTIQIDMTGKYLMPTLIDCHAHVGNLKGTTTSPDNYTDENVRRQLKKFQSFGVAAILSMGTEQPVGIPLRDSSKLGLIPGATLYSAIYGFGVKDAMPPAAAGFTHIYRPSTPAAADSMLRELIPHHPDVIKIWVDDYYGQYRHDQIMKPEIYSAIIKEAHANNIRVAAHLYHLYDAHQLVDAGLDIMAHSIRDAEIDDSLLAKMKTRQITYIPTLSLDEFAFAYGDDPDWISDASFKASLEPGVYDLITSPAYKEKTGKSSLASQEEQALQIALTNLLKIYRAGIPIALGTDAGANILRAQGFAEHMELALMVRAGIPTLEAIRIATQGGARLLHIDTDEGTIEKGKRANFIVLDKDPLVDIHNTLTISAVWKDGVKVSDGPRSH